MMAMSLVKQGKNGRFFLRRHVEEIRHVTTWNDQDVAGCEAVIVVADIGEFALKQNHCRSTKLAGRLTNYRHYLIACGLIGLPVPPVMISGGPQKKNS